MKSKEFELLKKQLISEKSVDKIEFGNCIQADTIFVQEGV